MVTKILIIGILEYISGVIFNCFEKQKLGATLMLLNPVGLIVFACMSVELGVTKSLKIYLLTLSNVLLDD